MLEHGMGSMVQDGVRYISREGHAGVHVWSKKVACIKGLGSHHLPPIERSLVEKHCLLAQ